MVTLYSVLRLVCFSCVRLIVTTTCPRVRVFQSNYSNSRMTSILQQVLITFPYRDKVKIKDPSEVERLVTTLVQKGPKSLQIITDFDATLTRYHLDGKRCDSSYGIIANTPLVPEEYRRKAGELYHKYYPIEIDPNLTIEQKVPYMIEWYEKSHEYMVSTKPLLKKVAIKEMVELSATFLRDNSKLMLEKLNNADVPVLVLSAGIGDVVHEVLKHNDVDFPNAKIISNFMKFDESGTIIGFQEPLIHMYNKNEAAVHDDNTKYFQDLKMRKTVLLMGDCLGDANMAHGVASPEAVLKIGFLNTTVEDLDSFMAAFDIVLVDDQSMDFINLLLDHVINNSNASD